MIPNNPPPGYFQGAENCYFPPKAMAAPYVDRGFGKDISNLSRAEQVT